MDHRQAGRYWDGNADAWTRLSREGYDVYRDAFNTPAFLALLPDVRGLRGLDIGCGEGHNTRLVARRGARMTAVDVAPRFVRHAADAEREEPLGIRYCTASAVELPFAGQSFDFAVAFMSLMEMPETGRALAEAHRVIRPGGFLQFSITHPCYDTPHRKNIRNEQGLTFAVEVGDYFRALEGRVIEWTFSTAPQELKDALPRFRTPMFTRTLSQWCNLLVDTGFAIERLQEPRPSDRAVRACPAVQDAQVVAYFLHVRARKTGG